jgi:hypothetical protein
VAQQVSDPVESAVRRWWYIQRAPASIYGTLIGASVLAVSDDDDPIAEVAVAVVLTILIYWAAERWSAVLGAYLQNPEPITPRAALRIFAEGYPMVQASYVPLFVMLLVRLFGGSDASAVNAALVVTIAVLIALGALAGRRSGLQGWGIVLSAAFTGALGLAVVALKAVLH